MGSYQKLLKSISLERIRKKIIHSSYKHVYGYKTKNGVVWQAYIPKYQWSKHFITEKEAALAVDLKLIENKISPINTLVKIENHE